MEEKSRKQRPNDPFRDGQEKREQSPSVHQDEQRNVSVNKSTEDLDEKSSTIGSSDRSRNSGLTSKDGLTGSDYDGQVTR